MRGLQEMGSETALLNILTQVSPSRRPCGRPRELLRDHLKQSTRRAIRQGETAAEAMCDEVVEIVFRHGR